MDSPSYPPPPPPVNDPFGGGGPDLMRKASFGARLVAYIIDAFIVGIPTVILYEIAKGAGYAVGVLLSVAYFSYFEGGETGQTFGKRAMGIKVVDVRASGPIGYGRGAIRWVGKIISGIVCYLGFLWMLWDPEKQCWQDKIASTYVVRT